jgi:peptidoglycan/xylan/chitin deacetylase (PgdA/CDA1 family)
MAGRFSHTVISSILLQGALVVLSLINVGLLFLSFRSSPFPVAVPLLFVALILAVIGVAILFPHFGIFSEALARVRTKRPLLALTFDDGPDPVHTPRVLNLLEQHKARATFFVTGEQAARHPDLVRDIAARGHQVENHSLNHSIWTPFVSPKKLRAELEATQQILGSILGDRPRWFRPPYGVVSPRVALAARRAGLTICHWSGRARDGAARIPADRGVRNIARGLTPGSILLLHDAVHDGSRQAIAAEILESTLPMLAQKGLRSVTLDELVQAGESVCGLSSRRRW